MVPIGVIPAGGVGMSAEDAYAYPSTTELVLVIQSQEVEKHIIFTQTNVAAVLTATDGTGYGKAPIGTTIIQSTSAAVQIHVKEVDGTWTSK